MTNRELLKDILGPKTMNVLARTTITSQTFAVKDGLLEIVPHNTVVDKYIIKDGEWDNTLLDLPWIVEDLTWLLTQSDESIDAFFTSQNMVAKTPQPDGEQL